MSTETHIRVQGPQHPDLFGGDTPITELQPKRVVQRTLTDDEARREAGLKPAAPGARWAMVEGVGEPVLIWGV